MYQERFHVAASLRDAKVFHVATSLRDAEGFHVATSLRDGEGFCVATSLRDEEDSRLGETRPRGRGDLRTVQKTIRQWAITILLALSIGLSSLMFPVAQAQEVKIWEFSPYDVEIWYAFDANLDIPEFAREQFIRGLTDELDRIFQATWRVHMTNAAPEMRTLMIRDLSSFQVKDLTREELVLVVNKDAAQSSIRTFDSAVEKLDEIAISVEHKLKLDLATKEYTEGDSPATQMLGKLKTIEGGLTEIATGLASKAISGALVPTSALPLMEAAGRPLATVLPWQIESLLRQRDKLIMLYIGQEGNQFYAHARELDCPMQFLGPTMRREAINWSHTVRAASSAIVAAFAPIARVEDAESKTAVLRLRAGGLIMTDENPAAVVPGDLMQPIVRRDDRNGQPSLLEPLSWTYACVTESDGIKLGANVYSYSGGPGLEGRKNRRTQRVLLKVRPLYETTDVLVTVRGTGKPQGGCAIYERDLATEELTLLGKTDWRGRLAITVPTDFGTVLPEAIRAARAAAKRAAEEAAEKAAAEKAAVPTNPNATPVDNPVAAEVETLTPAADKPEGTDKPQEPDNDADMIALRHPLMQLYVKSGDIVLARLPLVPGLKQIEVAQLPDDTRRLEAEAFMRGFQGEILDLIGLRSLLSARITLLVKDSKLAEAEKLLAELRALKDYSAMADSLDGLQRKILDESAGPITPGTQIRIDNMFQATREMLQKFLQNDLVRDAETAVNRALKAPTAPSEVTPAGESTEPATAT